MTPTPIRVMLVDDHAVVRRGLAAFLMAYDDLDLAGQAVSGEEAVRICTQVNPDVVLMDLVMPGMNGAETTRELLQRCPSARVLALTSFAEKEMMEDVLAAGAIGYLLKNVASDELAQAIRDAHAGRGTMAPEAAETLALADRLERLARDVDRVISEMNALPGILLEHVPGLFPGCWIEIRLFPEEILLCHPAGSDPIDLDVWHWMRTAGDAHAFAPHSFLPWRQGRAASGAVIVAPILAIDRREAIGGLHVACSGETADLSPLLQAARALAAHIAFAVHSARVHAKALAQERMARELSVAARIQASLLPEALPQIPGWSFAAVLDPARETSGDFYDAIPLPGGRWGLAIADVADKGVGPALFMALSRTLLRTYAREYPEHPAEVLRVVNARILAEARSGLFVTLFYAVIDPASAGLVYANAGHPPPYLVRADGSGVEGLGRTGMALGVLESETWQEAAIDLALGDLLLLYTDGVIDASDEAGKPFGRERLLRFLCAEVSRLPAAVVDDLLLLLRRFADGAPQLDDVTLLAVARHGLEG
ncbi:MAG: SpoIIE family protein phosphatase [Anaerolineae bacterium]|nr:SpoIIE family protein phosphatase [Anaerolineae bacterium]